MNHLISYVFYFLFTGYETLHKEDLGIQETGSLYPYGTDSGNKHLGDTWNNSDNERWWLHQKCER